MAQWQIAFVREQSVDFAVAAVSDSVLMSKSAREKTARELTVLLNVPVVLLGEQKHRLFGRPDLVRFLKNVHPARLPWRRVTLAA
jgi:hypothetical protein